MTENTGDDATLLSYTITSESTTTGTFKFKPPLLGNRSSEQTTRRCTLPPRLLWPVLALIIQPIMLGVTMWFMVWTAQDYRRVPHHLDDFITNNRASATTAFTLLGSALSLVNTKFFAEALRFAINVSMGNPKSNGISLYSFYAATIVASKSPILNFGTTRLIMGWGVVSVISFTIFTVQTSAWTTLFTPQPFLIPNQLMFSEPNVLDPAFDGIGFVPEDDIEQQMSGIVAARRSLNLTDAIVHKGFQFNYTTLGIYPFPDVYQGQNPKWTQITAVQQGVTAEVTCEVASDSDPAVKMTTQKISNDRYVGVFFCCNCTTPGSPYAYPFVLDDPTRDYLAFMFCPYLNNTEEQGITVYTRGSESYKTFSKKCTIKPQILNVNVTYYSVQPNAAIVALKPLNDSLENPPLNSSIVVVLLRNLSNAFITSQVTFANGLLSALDSVARDGNKTIGSRYPDYDHLTNQIMKSFMKGVIDIGGTSMREGLVDLTRGIQKMNAFGFKPPHGYILPLDNKTSMTQVYTSAFVWESISASKIPSIASPLIIMAATVVITLHTFFRYWCNSRKPGDLDYIMHFDPMDALHVIAACKSSDMSELAFPDYSQDIAVSRYGGRVHVGLRKRAL